MLILVNILLSLYFFRENPFDWFVKREMTEHILTWRIWKKKRHAQQFMSISDSDQFKHWTSTTFIRGPSLPPLSTLSCTAGHITIGLHICRFCYIHWMNNVRQLETLHFLVSIILFGYYSMLQILLYMLYKLFFTNYKNDSITYLSFYFNCTNHIYCHISL